MTVISRTTMALVISAAIALPAAAQTLTGNMNVRIQIQAQCTMTAPADLDFGTSGLLATAVLANTTMSVTCTNTTPYAIAMGQGANYDSAGSIRRMAGGATEFVSYELCRDTGCSLPWGATAGTGGNTYGGTGTGQSQSIPIYGRVPAQNTPSPRAYTDVVAVTLTY